MQGSEKLLQLVSNDSHTQNFGFSNVKGSEAEHNNSECETSNLQGVPSVSAFVLVEIYITNCTSQKSLCLRAQCVSWLLMFWSSKILCGHFSKYFCLLLPSGWIYFVLLLMAWYELWWLMAMGFILKFISVFLGYQHMLWFFSNSVCCISSLKLHFGTLSCELDLFVILSAFLSRYDDSSWESYGINEAIRLGIFLKTKVSTRGFTYSFMPRHNHVWSIGLKTLLFWNSSLC